MPRRLLAAACSLLVLVLASAAARAASTGSSDLHMPEGGGTPTADGEYVSTTLNTSYHFWIEVPPGVGRLTVQVFDADIGRGGNGDANNNRDRSRNGYDSSVNYTLIRPNGTTAVSLTNCDDNTCNDNVWTTLINSTSGTNTAAGHWELRVDLSGSTGDDINAIGVRANDGDETGDGTELPIYVDNIDALGVDPISNPASRDYALYPYITSGCTASENDFDYDSDAGTVGSIGLSSRTGAYTQTIPSSSLSSNNAWKRNTINRWTSDQLSTEYGIWTSSDTITTYVNGAGLNGNYTQLYFANSSAAANPPGANPASNGFRVYLPTDDGSAPVKPYVEQLLTFKSGNNPPGVGQTARYQITIRVVNPTAESITFSSSNLVTAHVPGGNATYAGNAAVGQGTIVSQPSVGGSGNITWNPGTLAAGATSILTYQVNVTPTSSGQRIVVTGTPASNGTTARYVDETGNTTQGRATFTFGPLCELAVTQGLLTHAVVHDFRALPGERGGVVVEWRTADEAGTAGFRLARREGDRWVPVRGGLIAALQRAPQGGIYRVLDERAQPGELLTYRLEEVESKGTQRALGTFEVIASRDDEPVEITAEATPNATARPRARERARTQPVAANPGPTAAGKVLWIGVGASGIYRLDAAELAASSSLTLAEVAADLRKGKARLTRGATETVSWFPDLRADGSATGLFFYGDAQPSLYSTLTPYRLELEKPGTRMAALAVAATPPLPATSFAAREHSEVDSLAATVLPLDPNAVDYWFWDFLQAGDSTHGARTFAIAAPGATSAAATLTVHLQGATDSGVAGEHVAQVSVNGTAIGSVSWSGLTAKDASFAVPAGVLLPSGNQVTLTASVGGGAPFSLWYVNAFDLDYARTFAADATALTFTAGPDGATVTGFPGGTIRVLEISDPAHPRWVTGATTGDDGGSFTLSLAPSVSGRFVASAAPLSATSIRPWTRTPATPSASLLVVASDSLADGARSLAAARRGAGISTLVLTVDQIADGWGDGTATPQAVRAAVRAVAEKGGGKLRSLLLLGDGTIDYRDLFGFGGNLVPLWMTRTPSGIFPADNDYGDLDGDGVPEVAVGRVPVGDAGELAAWVAKQQAYEQTPDASWAGTTLLLADAPDPNGAADFTVADDALAAELGNAAGPRIELDSTPIDAARQQLFAALADGAGVVNYFGHGGLDRLSGQGLLTSADVAGLTNAPRLPLLTAMSCTINRVGVPGVPSLGQLLLIAPGGGAIAVLAPTGLANHWDSTALAQSVHARAAQRGDDTIGEWLLGAYRDYTARDGNPAAVELYELLGDPTQRLHVAPPVVHGGGIGE